MLLVKLNYSFICVSHNRTHVSLRPFLSRGFDERSSLLTRVHVPCDKEMLTADNFTHTLITGSDDGSLSLYVRKLNKDGFEQKMV